ncbi:MAG: sensor histidine kinase, partial [Xanthobacteraceae bacterium]
MLIEPPTIDRSKFVFGEHDLQAFAPRIARHRNVSSYLAQPKRTLYFEGADYVHKYCSHFTSPTTFRGGQRGGPSHSAAISGLVRVRARAANEVADPKTFLLEIADRIETVAKLHLLLAYSNSGNVRLDQYLQEICDRLGSALAMNAPVYSVDCSPEHIVPVNVALPLGLITAELFSNSLKYAHPTGLPVRISLSCSRTPTDELHLSYEDDGVGFPESFDVSHDGHLGMRFIRSL